jgi:hypothetical protein
MNLQSITFLIGIVTMMVTMTESGTESGIADSDNDRYCREVLVQDTPGHKSSIHAALQPICHI